MSGSTTMTSGSSVGANRTLGSLRKRANQVLAVPARLHRTRQLFERAGRDVPHPVRDLLQARHHQSLSLFDRVNIVGGLHERLVRAGVQPGDAARELLDVKLRSLQVPPV